MNGTRLLDAPKRQSFSSTSQSDVTAVSVSHSTVGRVHLSLTCSLFGRNDGESSRSSRILALKDLIPQVPSSTLQQEWGALACWYIRHHNSASRSLTPLSLVGFVSASAYLGHEYVRLGKTSRAGLVFAQAELRVQNCLKAGTPVVSAVQVTYLTLYAEYLAALGNHDRRWVSEPLRVSETDTFASTAREPMSQPLRLRRLFPRTAPRSRSQTVSLNARCCSNEARSPPTCVQ
jgi:hypothetical protein